MKSKYKYQVVVHVPYYPSSVLFETESEAWEYYNSIKGAACEEYPLNRIQQYPHDSQESCTL